jgi:hypothetical protein
VASSHRRRPAVTAHWTIDDDGDRLVWPGIDPNEDTP